MSSTRARPAGCASAGPPRCAISQTIALNAAGVRYRYYLVWITSLGSHQSVAINEIALYT